MKKFIFCVLLTFVGLISVNAQEISDSLATVEILNIKHLRDSCRIVLNKSALHYGKGTYGAYDKNKKQYEYYRNKYKQYKKQYNNVISANYPLNDAGKYLKRSANCQIVSLCFVGVGAALIGGFSTIETDSRNYNTLSPEGKTALITTTGIVFGGSALGFYIASLVNKHKSGKILQNIQFTGNGFKYNF